MDGGKIMCFDNDQLEALAELKAEQQEELKQKKIEQKLRTFLPYYDDLT